MTSDKPVKTPSARPRNTTPYPTIPLTLYDEKQSPPKSNDEEWLEAFETDFWAEYPRRTCKFNARKAWMRIRPQNQAICDEIFAGLDRWKAYWTARGTEREYIPHPATWLNQRRWEDEP